MRTCTTNITTMISHILDLPVCCPVSHNPAAGSTVSVTYFPNGIVVPVEDLADWIAEYVGGHKTRAVRNMEEMIQDLAQRCADEVKVTVRVRANLKIKPPFGGEMQGMSVFVKAKPNGGQVDHAANI